MSLVIASNIVSDILTDLVRTKNSMVYSVWSSISLKKSNYGSISAYRTNNPVKVVELIRKSIDIAASGKCVSPFTGTDRNDDYVPIQDGLECLMTAHVLYPTLDEKLPATLSSKILTGILRDKMKYNGLVMTDAIEMNAIGKDMTAGDAAVTAFLAGADILLVCDPELAGEVLSTLVRAYDEGRITDRRLKESLDRRIS